MSFSVCVACLETPSIVSRFVTYYLDQGAENVMVYLDQGAPDPVLPPDPRITLMSCAALLEGAGLSVRPEYTNDFQSLAWDHAFEQLSSDWLLICDVDEIAGCNVRIGDALAHVPADWHYAILPVAEAVWGPEDNKFDEFGCSYFRTRAPKGLGKLQSTLLYGRNGRFLVAGLVGHSLGKYFIRKGAPVDALGVHEPYGAALKGGSTRDIQAVSDFFLHHFDSISFERWQKKWQGRIDKTRASRMFTFNKATAQYARRFAATTSEEERMGLFASLYELNGWQVRVLSALGQLRRKHLWGR